MAYRGVLIGCGFFAENHMHGWAEAEGAEIVAVCDLDPEKAKGMAERFGIAAYYTDANAALSEVKPDFVDVATTVDSHRPLVELAFSHGAAVICQKPFANTMADAQAMVDAGEKAGKPLFIHENFRWQVPLMKFRDKLQEGLTGRNCFARISFRTGYDVYAGQPYLAETEHFTLMDIGLHLFDVSRFLLGEAVDLHCRTQSLNPRIKGEDTFLVTLGQADGAIAMLDCSYYTVNVPDDFPEVLVRVEGEDGTLEVTSGYKMRLHKNGEVTEWNVEPGLPDWGEKPWHGVQESVAAFERHVVRVLDGKEEPQPSGRHNLTTMAMTLASYQSAESGETIKLKDFMEGAV